MSIPPLERRSLLIKLECCTGLAQDIEIAFAPILGNGPGSRIADYGSYRMAVAKQLEMIELSFDVMKFENSPKELMAPRPRKRAVMNPTANRYRRCGGNRLFHVVGRTRFRSATLDLVTLF